MNELIDQFLVEGRELIDQAAGDLLTIEKHPRDREALDSLFRAIHTLKGAAGIIEFDAMARVLHAAESGLAAARAADVDPDPAMIAACLDVLDQLAAWFDDIESRGEPPSDAEAATEALTARFAAESTPAHPLALTAGQIRPSPEPGPLAGPLSPLQRELLEWQRKLASTTAIEGREGRVASATMVASRVLRAAGLSQAALDVEALAVEGPSDVVAERLSRRLTDALDAAAEPAISPVEESVAPLEASARSMRVDADRIDALARLAGEIGAVKTAIGHLARQSHTLDNAETFLPLLREQSSRLDRLVTDLQRSILAVRLQAMRQVFRRFPRLVRELGVTLGKSVRLTTSGEDTEADKAIVEGLFEPLLHVFRNAMDHGIEPAAERNALGKPETAVIDLRAFRLGDRVIVEACDDGRGLDIDRIGRLAIARGLASAEAVAAMTDAEIAEFLFSPGFSTASKVTSVSGRGVGLDAVRVAISRLGGRVHLESRPGQGALVRFVLPFTAMMSRLMTVEAGGQRFGLPLDEVEGTLRVERARIETIGAARVVRWRDQSIPVTVLSEALSIEAGDAATTEASIVVIDLDGERSGLEVEAFGESFDVLLSPLPDVLAGARGVVGATLLGDGGVLIILDPRELLA